MRDCERISTMYVLGWAAVIVISTLTACASPTADTTSPPLTSTQYTVDLYACHGETTLYAAGESLAGAVVERS